MILGCVHCSRNSKVITPAKSEKREFLGKNIPRLFDEMICLKGMKNCFQELLLNPTNPLKYPDNNEYDNDNN